MRIEMNAYRKEDAANSLKKIVTTLIIIITITARLANETGFLMHAL